MPVRKSAIDNQMSQIASSQESDFAHAEHVVQDLSELMAVAHEVETMLHEVAVQQIADIHANLMQQGIPAPAELMRQHSKMAAKLDFTAAVMVSKNIRNYQDIYHDWVQKIHNDPQFDRALAIELLRKQVQEIQHQLISQQLPHVLHQEFEQVMDVAEVQEWVTKYKQVCAQLIEQLCDSGSNVAQSKKIAGLQKLAVEVRKELLRIARPLQHLTEQKIIYPLELFKDFQLKFSQKNNPQYLNKLRYKIFAYKKLYETHVKKHGDNLEKLLATQSIKTLKGMQSQIEFEMRLLENGLLPPDALRTEIEKTFPKSTWSSEVNKLLLDYMNGYQNMMVLHRNESVTEGKEKFLSLMQTLLFKTKSEALLQLAQNAGEKPEVFCAVQLDGFQHEFPQLHDFVKEFANGRPDEHRLAAMPLDLYKENTGSSSLQVLHQNGVSNALLKDYERGAGYEFMLGDMLSLSAVNAAFDAANRDDLVRLVRDHGKPCDQDKARAEVNAFTQQALFNNQNLNLILSGLLAQGGLSYTLCSLFMKNFELSGNSAEDIPDFFKSKQRCYQVSFAEDNNAFKIEAYYAPSLLMIENSERKCFFPAPEALVKYQVEIAIKPGFQRRGMEIVKETVQMVCVNNTTYQFKPMATVDLTSLSRASSVGSDLSNLGDSASLSASSNSVVLGDCGRSSPGATMWAERARSEVSDEDSAATADAVNAVVPKN